MNTFLPLAICAGTGAAGGSASCCARETGTARSAIWHNIQLTTVLMIFKFYLPGLLYADFAI